MKKFQVQCESCGKLIADNGPHFNEEGDSYCSACAAILQETCSCCGKNYNTWNMTCTSQDEYYCETCATAYN
jgi:hypothetical protein